jgi:hypothetical protein
MKAKRQVQFLKEVPEWLVMQIIPIFSVDDIRA